MHKGSIKIIFYLFVCILNTAYSQRVINSPYSRYGLGELQQAGFANNLSMGGISAGLQNDTIAPYNINFSNPASHSTLRLTVFDFGLKSNTLQLESSDKKYVINKTSLSYLAIAFPVISGKWGASFGLLPFSNVGYKIYDEKEEDNIGLVKYTYDGTGGINQVYFGNGFRIKRFSVGINTSYLFGDLSFNSRDSFPHGTFYTNSFISQVVRVGDFYHTFGVQYKQPLKKNWSITLGLTGGLNTQLNVKKSTFAATYKSNYGIDLVKDTIVNDIDVRESIKIPMSLGGGVVIKKGTKWLFGFDYSVQDWSTFDSFGQKGLLGNSNRFAFGMQFIPNKNAAYKDGYYKKISYRAGFRYADSYLEIHNTQLKDYAITFGAGFPLRKIQVGQVYTQSIVNVGFEIGENGAIQNQLVRERYIKAIFSFTLNDRWFIKRKYD